MVKRYKSLDVFRGITVASMILVNTPGNWAYLYKPLQHADWHGYTPTDLVFPFFLIAVGLSMSFSFANHQELDRKAFLLKTLRRSILIFVIGLALNAFPFIGKDYSHLRIFGVLQRIALAYFFASLFCYYIKPKSWLLIFSSLILVFYWQLLHWFGGSDPYGLALNLPRQVDLIVIGDTHMWHGKKIAFDPEGLISTIPSIVTVISGYLIGRFIQSNNKIKALTILSSVSIGLVILGYIWSLVMPINKALWTSSYVLVTSGIAGLFLTLLIYLIDFSGIDKWSKPFEIFGMNPLISFIASILWVKIYFLIKIGDQNLYGWIYNEVFKQVINPTFGSFLFAITHVIGCWLIAYLLYKKKIIVKV